MYLTPVSSGSSESSMYSLDLPFLLAMLLMVNFLDKRGVWFLASPRVARGATVKKSVQSESEVKLAEPSSGAGRL